MEMKTSKASARISTPYTWIMPLLAKKEKKPLPLLLVLAAFFLGALVVLLAALACRVKVVVLDFDCVGFFATWLTIFILKFN